MLKITSHPDVSTALCPWGLPVSTPVFTAMSFLPSARAVSASPATQTQAVKPSALDMAAVTTRLVFVKLATKATSVKIWIVQVFQFYPDFLIAKCQIISILWYPFG